MFEQNGNVWQKDNEKAINQTQLRTHYENNYSKLFGNKFLGFVKFIMAHTVFASVYQIMTYQLPNTKMLQIKHTQNTKHKTY